MPALQQALAVGRNLNETLFNLKYLFFILFSLSLFNCSNSRKEQPEKIITITKYDIVNDSSKIISILNKIQQKHKSNIDYRDFVGKLLSITFSNNSHGNIYLLKPLHLDDSKAMFKNFTASIHLLQVSDDSLKWQNIFNRQPVDTYDAEYDTMKSKSTITKLAYIDNNQKSKYLKLLLEYRSDSSYFNDTIQIVTFK